MKYKPIGPESFSPIIQKHEYGEVVKTVEIPAVLENKISVERCFIHFQGEIIHGREEIAGNERSFVLHRYDKNLELINVFEALKVKKNDFDVINLFWKVNENQDHLVFFAVLEKRDTKNTEIYFSIVDKDWQVVKEGKHELPFPFARSTMQHIFMSPSGKVVLHFNIYASNPRTIKNFQKSMRQLCLVYLNRDTDNVFPILRKDKNIQDISIGFDDNEDIIVHGLYQNKSDSQLGHFIQSIRMDASIKQTLFEQALEDDLINQHKTELTHLGFNLNSDLQKMSLDLNHFVFRKYLSSSQGHLMIYEQFHRSGEIRTNTDPPTEIDNRAVHKGSLLVVLLNREGRPVWSQLIQRKFSAAIFNDYLSDFSAVWHEDKLLLFFNDTQKNFNQYGDYLGPIDAGGRKVKMNALTRVKLDMRDGASTRKMIGNVKTLKGHAVPKLCVIDENAASVFIPIREKLKNDVFKYAILRTE